MAGISSFPFPDAQEQIIKTIIRITMRTPTHMPTTISKLECFSSPGSLIGFGTYGFVGGDAIGDTGGAGAEKKMKSWQGRSKLMLQKHVKKTTFYRQFQQFSSNPNEEVQAN